MRVGILTFHFSDNYGAMFQAYALKAYLESLGHQAFFIDYKPSYLEKGGRFTLRKPVIKNNLKVAYLHLNGFRNRIFTPSTLEQSVHEFQRTYLGTVPYFSSPNHLRAPSLDLVITGSDQVWNPQERVGVDNTYFLERSSFEERYGAVRRISYAPSFGSDELKPEFGSEVGNLVSDLDAVSVREESGKVILAGLTDKHVSVVPDPTLLLEDFSAIYQDYAGVGSNYIFVYYLRSPINVREVAQEASVTTNAGEIISVHNPHRRWREIGRTVYPSPGQWLKLHKNARVVVTNSFHGVALSIVQRKDFLYVPLEGERSRMNARALNLLKAVGLENRIASSQKDVKALLDEGIDWVSVGPRVAQLRSNGTEFLKEQLEIAYAKAC